MKSKRINKKVNGKEKKKRRTLKKMNCNPASKEKKVPGSCYTKNALQYIRHAWNRKHQDKINISEPKEIWSELRSRLTDCEKEDCFLKEIKDDEARRQLDDILFAPDRPNSWNNDPRSWLSNYDIASVLRQYEKANKSFKMLGPSAIDYDTKIPEENNTCVWEDLCRLSLEQLIRRNKRKLGVIFNLDKHDGPGTHWVSMFIDLDNRLIFYYDSALNAVPREVSRLKNEIIKQGNNLKEPIQFDYMQNEHAHQSTNTECGMYCLFFIITFLTQKLHPRVRNKLMLGGGKGKLPLEKIIDIFTKPGINDDLMAEFRSIYFNKK